MSAPPDSVAIPLRDDSGVGEARRAARALARAVGFQAVAAEEVAIVATEAARNAVRHGGGGELVLTADPGRTFVDVLALDRGRGIPDLRRAMEDGYSTAGTPGHGLGAMARMAALLDVYSAPGQGTALLARMGTPPRTAPGAIEFGAVCVAVAPEPEAGDAWAIATDGERAAVLVADGLGHGVRAAEAARAAVAAFRRLGPGLPAEQLVDRLHRELRPTRGAAVAVAELAAPPLRVRYAGIGNISGVLEGSPRARQMVSMPGTAGHEARTIRAFDYDWGNGPLIMHSDGVATHWELASYPGLARRHPALVAGVVYRDHARRRDDATVVVVRRAP